MCGRLGKLLGRFRKREEGSSTIEAVLWLPVLIGFIALAADAAFVFFGQNQAYRVVQNANRTLSVGRFSTELEVETYLETTIGAFAPNVSAETTIDNGMVTSVVTIPVNDLIATNIITSFMNFDLTVGATHFVEF